MVSIIELFELCSMLFVMAFAGFVAGFLFTERFKPLFNFKPFNCRPCLTFWLTLVLEILVVSVFFYFTEVPKNLFTELLAGVIALLAAFINYLIAKQNTIIEP